jgi:hypothetical protein
MELKGELGCSLGLWVFWLENGSMLSIFCDNMATWKILRELLKTRKMSPPIPLQLLGSFRV